ncbi:MAG: ABC transporter ATP-binding protein [Acidobacteria bacterium]|nr:MAG: ABC transporter ATP-binding protein [Acidobacteriota bacterium]PYS15408.1 MAG: ABC transporter ATP-binding protein [Acidobacteriota bacterium]
MKSLTWRLYQEVRPYSWHLAALFSLGLLGTPLALLTPMPLKIAVDSVIGSHRLPRYVDVVLPAAIKDSQSGLLAMAAVFVILLAFLNQLREFGTSVLTAYAGEQMLRGFRTKLFRHVQRLSLSYHDSRGTADSIYRIQYDAGALQNIFITGIVPSVSSVVTVASMVYVTARINWKFALVGLSVAPFILIVSRHYRRELRSQSRKVRHIESSALSVVQEVLVSVRVVKAFGQEGREEGRFMQKSNEGMQARIQQTLIEGGYGMAVTLLTALGMAIVLYLGVVDIKSGRLTLGNLLLVMGYLGQLYSPLRTVGKKMATMQSHFVSAERAFALLDAAPEVVERENARSLARARGGMAFRQVSFSYENKGQPVLQEISFEVRPGQCVGIVGATGAGKTTLVNLLTRFYDPTEGDILLDGLDLREYKVADLRNQFGIVLQEPILFSTSIAENIAYARPGAAQSEIVDAARSANAHDFIVSLPDGYDTLVGERGMRLSGGERQRLSVARAFLKDAPILILDEPTSSIDAKTEAALLETMERLVRGRTTFIITHRLSALKHCDMIVTIEKGRLVAVEPGTKVLQL